MQQHIHSSLGWLTPVEFGQQWRLQQRDIPQELAFFAQIFH